MMNTGKCFMNKGPICKGMINCFPDCDICPFFKTEEEQRAIEESIVQRFKDNKLPYDYQSCINGEILYSVHKMV